MQRNLVVLFLLFYSTLSFAQQTLTIEGTVVNNTLTGNWSGVNIPRDAKTNFTYRNNSITSVNSQGYMLQAGDESPGITNNNLDGEIITGNKFMWNGPNSPSIITHGLFAGYNINSVVKYNYLNNVPYGIIFKSGTDAGVNMTFTSGGCAYNICRNGKFAGRAKGINGVKFYNNTFYSGDGQGWYLLLITANMDRPVPAPSVGTKVFNNIFYSTIQIPMIKIESGSLNNFESDYNIFWCSAGEPTFNIDGSTVTWVQWRARGYDAHSRIVNPNFLNTIDFVPSVRLDYGIDLGTDWQKGLSVSATWVPGTSPATTDQNGTWQVGARVYPEQKIYVTAINVTGAGGSGNIASDDGTLQLSAEILPSSATNKSITWSITNGTGQATISPSGLVTAVANGTVTAAATANDGSGVRGTLLITISNQIIIVSSIIVTGAGGASLITDQNGTLQLNAAVLPSNASNKTVTWSVNNGTGQATISTTGVVTAISDGTVTAVATANDGSAVYGTLIITIASQLVPVTSITVSGTGGLTYIDSENGTILLNATVLPEDAADKSVQWSVTNETGQALIDGSGLLTAISNGTVTAKATANDGSGVYGILVITITNQNVPVTSVTVKGEGGVSIIVTNQGTLQLSTDILPVYATNKSVTWSVSDGYDYATIDSNGLLSATDNGTVTIRATANDGSGIYGSLDVVISGQIIKVTNILVTGDDGINTISKNTRSLQLNAIISPANATNKEVTWSLINGSELASIDVTGLVTAIGNGIVTARATSRDGSGVSGTMDISIDITNQKLYSVTVNSSEIRITFYEDYVSWTADLYNYQGRQVMRKIIDSNSLVFNTTNISPGFYLVVLSKKDHLLVEKIVIQ